MEVGILNGVVITCNGLFRVSDIGVEDAKTLVHDHGVISAIGHKATAKIVSNLLGIEVHTNRIEFRQQVGQPVIALQLNKRQPEGSILDVKEMMAIGYTLKLIQRIE